MFYSEAILSRRGPLGGVWLAAHMERKLTKAQTLSTDIEKSVDTILGQEVEVMALRLTGQLLLGVVRIYSRKAHYLLEDCTHANTKLKMAFRPGLVDMAEEQIAINPNAITLQGNALDLDLLLPDINWDGDMADFDDGAFQNTGQHVARIADITLATADNFDDLGGDLDQGTGIGSQDFDDPGDLGITFGDDSVEQGRDAGEPRRHSIASNILGRGGDMDVLSQRSGSRAPSLGGFDAPYFDPAEINLPEPMDVDNGPGGFDGGMDDGGMDLDFLDFGDRDAPKSPAAEEPRQSSVLSEPPADGEEAGEPTTPKAPRKPKEKKQIIDEVIQLTSGPGALGRGLGPPVNTDVSGIMTEQQYLPRSAVVMRLREIEQDPMAHFMPTVSNANGTFVCAAPPGLPPQLRQMFMRPVQQFMGASKKRSASKGETSPSKKARKAKDEDEEEQEEDVEQGRRAPSLAPSFGAPPSFHGGDDDLGGYGDDTGPGDFQMEVPDFDDAPIDLPQRSVSRLTTPGINDDITPARDVDADCKIGTFAGVPATQAPGKEVEGKGYSRSTIKAMGVIQRELKGAEAQGEEEPVMSFDKMADKASRRAASSFFFELLVLGTRDCIKISQPAPYEDIEVTAKEKLWEHDVQEEREESVAPSMRSSVAPSRAAPRSSMPRSSIPPPSIRSSIPPNRESSAGPSINSEMGL